VGEPGGYGTHPLGALQARLDQQIPHLYRDLALYLQVLREVLPMSLDQACSHLATQVYPRRYNRMRPLARRQLHRRLKTLLRLCCSFLTVEQLLSLASQITRERQRLALREQANLLRRLEGEMGTPPAEEGGARTPSGGGALPSGSIQLNLSPPLTGPAFSFPFPLHGPVSPAGASPAGEEEVEADSASDGLPPELIAALDDASEDLETPWSDGQLPRDPVLLIHCLECLDVALGRRLRNLSHSVNVELLRAGLTAGLLPVPVLDAVLNGQIEPQGAPANLLRLPFLPADKAFPHQAPMGVLLRTVDLEMEQPRLRTCRRRLLRHRQEILKMAESSHRLQRRLQAHHAERLWRHDSQLNPPEGI
jgi:hypothetical protein